MKTAAQKHERPVDGHRASTRGRTGDAGSDSQLDCTRNRLAVKRHAGGDRRVPLFKRQRSNGLALTVETLLPGRDVRIRIGDDGRYLGFVIIHADELEGVVDALTKELAWRRAAKARSSESREAAIATGNRLRFLRERGQRDGYVAAFRDDGLSLSARAGGVQHWPESISEQHASLLADYRAELLAELEEIARTVAPAPNGRAVGASSRRGAR